MRLTRRDAVAALGALGIGSYVAGRVTQSSEHSNEVATLHAVAEILYPSRVDVDERFVETYVLGRSRAQAAYERQMTAGVAELDRQARQDFGQSFHTLSADNRRTVLRNTGVDRVQANPDGTLSQRIRYYVINDLLYAFYTTPVGGRLLDIENPPGHPGGRSAYQRGPTQQQ